MSQKHTTEIISLKLPKEKRRCRRIGHSQPVLKKIVCLHLGRPGDWGSNKGLTMTRASLSQTNQPYFFFTMQVFAQIILLLGRRAWMSFEGSGNGLQIHCGLNAKRFESAFCAIFHFFFSSAPKKKSSSPNTFAIRSQSIFLFTSGGIEFSLLR